MPMLHVNPLGHIEMTHTLYDIFDLEDSGNINKALNAYLSIYSKTESSYEIWKHFYFFLWNVTEEGTDAFNVQNNIEQPLRDTFQEGRLRFSDIADFNFIAGYTISLLPGQFGDHNEWSQKGLQMLLKSTELDKDNTIYRLGYLGFVTNINDEEYMNAEVAAVPQVLNTYSGKGSLNKYFKVVLYRGTKKVYR